ncbi:MAG: SLC13 family permease [Lentisphaerales bacterium]|nr:SLC13 family permease [Lentisphaerales bacterium]
MFLLNRIPMELTALASALALALFGIITPQEMLQGFSNSTVITIAALFIIGAALFETGVAENIAGKLIGLTKGNELLFLLTVIILTAVLSGFLSNTGTVAVMIPTVIAAAKKLKKSPADFLLPMAFSASIGGMLTLIGTPPNIVIANAFEENGMKAFSFFEYGYLGMPILIAYLIYLKLFPQKSSSEVTSVDFTQENFTAQLAEVYELKDKVFRLRIRENSGLIGKPLKGAKLSESYNVNIIAVDPAGEQKLQNPVEQESSYKHPFEEDDVLIAAGEFEDIERMALEFNLGIQAAKKEDQKSRENLLKEIGLAEAIIPQRSTLNQQSIRKIGFFERYKVRVLGIMRNGKALKLNFVDEPLKFGDQLLLIGQWNEINQLQKDKRNFIIYGRPERLRKSGRKELNFHSWLSTGALIAMVLMMLLKVFPMVLITILVALFLILSGCVKMEAAYRSISWQSVILIAAMIPMSTALNNTGGAQLVADNMVGVLGGSGPLVLLTGIFLLTTVFSQFISNTATTILIAPIAFKTAEPLGLSPYPILMMVAAGASAAFLTPIASPVNTLVLGPGGYSFGDFAKKGGPLILLVMIVSLILIPIIWPLKP